MKYKGFLTRGADGRYVFSAFKPRIKKPPGSEVSLIYPVPGDPFFTGIEKTWCDAFIHSCGVGPLEPFTPYPATLSISLSDT